jgi:ligand-binding sensor domain-containing protein/signal transduction histidine kinase
MQQRQCRIPARFRFAYRAPGFPLHLVISSLHCAFLCLLFSTSVAHTQILLLKDYSTNSGLPDSRVAPILQDHSGYLWFGTQAGLTRYDGREFVSYGPPHEIPGIFGRQILEDHTGAIWFAFSGFHRGGITRNVNGSSVTISMSNGLHGEQAFGLAEDRTGAIWAATTAGLERISFTDSTRSAWTVSTPIDTGIMAVFSDPNVEIWYASSAGLSSIRNGRGVLVWNASPRSGMWHVRPYSFYRAHDGSLWFGGYWGAYRFAQNRLHYYGRAEGLPERGVWCFQEDGRGTFWVGAMDGLYRGTTTGEGASFRKVPSFGDNVIYDMCLDREDNLWFASPPGLRRLLPDVVELSFPGEHELDHAGIGPIIQYRSSAIYFGSRSTGLYALRNGSFFHDRDYGESSTLTITSILPDTDNQLLVGLWRGGIVERGRGYYRKVTTLDGLPTDDIHALLRLPSGNVLVGTSDGIALLSSQKRGSRVLWADIRGTTVFDICRFHLPGEHVSGIGTYIAGTANGALMLRMSRDSLITAEPFLEGSGTGGRCVYQILEDTRHRLWLGTDGGGVVCFDGKGYHRYTQEDGLATDRVFALAEDSLGTVWIGTSSGVSAFDGKGFHNLAYDQGFAETGVHGLMTDPDGNLWVSTYPGVKKLRPLPFRTHSGPPPLYLTGVIADGASVDPTGDTELHPDVAVISFRFAALSFRDESAVRYRYQLEGFDKGWSEPTTSREVRYTHLPSGRYRFTVMARGAEGVWTDIPVTFSFSILPPLWFRWWFLTLGISALVALAYLFYRYRLKKAIELERTRSRIAMDLHDDIGSSLARISVMTAVAQHRAVSDPSVAAEYFSLIGESARDLVESLGDIVWTVDPKQDNLQTVIRRIVQFGQELCEGRGISFETDLTGTYEAVRVTPEQKRDIYLVFKEGVHNVVKHSGATRVRFCTRPASGRVILELLDNGRGLSPEAQPTGHGLGSMHERGARAGVRFAIVSRAEGGTAITLEVKTG